MADTSATLRLPQVLTGAVAVWPIRNAEHEWKIETDLDYVFWDAFQNLNVKLSNGAVLPFPLDWKNSIVLYVGTEYKWLRMDHLPDWEVALWAGSGFRRLRFPTGPTTRRCPMRTIIPSRSGWGCSAEGTVGSWVF